MTTSTLRTPPPPATLEQRAFRGLEAVGGLPTLRFKLYNLIAAPQLWSDREPTSTESDAAIAHTAQIRDCLVELHRVVSKGLTREQLLEILEVTADMTESELGVLRNQAASHRTDVLLDYGKARKANPQLPALTDLDLAEAEQLLDLHHRMQQAEFVAQGAEEREADRSCESESIHDAYEASARNRVAP